MTKTADYTFTVINDMGHIEVHGSMHQSDITAFVYKQAQRYLLTATDKDGLGIRYFCLRDGMQPKWVYQYGDKTVLIHWNVDTFDPTIMRPV
jgi:hypothetical protein